MAADAAFVFRKSAFDVCRNAGIEGPVFTLYDVHKIHRGRIQHFAVLGPFVADSSGSSTQHLLTFAPLVAPTGLARDT